MWSPALGSFLAVDEFVFQDPTSTLWGWPNQNPISFSDPSGRCPACWGALGGAIVGGLAYAATAPTSMSWGDFGKGAVEAAAVGGGLGALATVNPQAAFIALGALGVASDKDLWKLGLAAGLPTARGMPLAAGSRASQRGMASIPRGRVKGGKVRPPRSAKRGGAARALEQQEGLESAKEAGDTMCPADGEKSLAQINSSKRSAQDARTELNRIESLEEAEEQFGGGGGGDDE
jgi:hypothetical protein